MAKSLERSPLTTGAGHPAFKTRLVHRIPF